METTQKPNRTTSVAWARAAAEILATALPRPGRGIRAQIQHRKAYASNEALAGDCIHSRFHLVIRGVAPYVE